MGSQKSVTNERLIEENQGLVYHLATRIHRGLPVRHEYDDLVGYGMVGLAEAAKSFVPSRGAKFSTFAFFRIRGAIYDGLSEGSWMSRAQYRQHLKQQKAAQSQFEEGEDGKSANDERNWNYGTSEVVELTQEHVEQLADSDSDSTAPHIASKEETARILCQCVESLPRRENRLITSIYFEGLTLQDAADRIGISKSWASRLHAKVIRKLGVEISRPTKEQDSVKED